MKASFMATATYYGPAPSIEDWPAPPHACDRQIASRSINLSLRNAHQAEELGFDWVSVSEHHYSPYLLTPNPIVLGGALSQVLRHATIALLGPLVPLCNPVRLAEEIALLDSISGGRVVALLLRGTKHEQDVYDQIADNAKEMTREGIDLVLKAWTTPDPFSWEGKHYQFKTVSVWPRPIQEPHPPVFASGNSDDSTLFAARRGLGLAMSFLTPGKVKRTVDLYREEAAKTGWTPTPEHVIYRGLVDIKSVRCEETPHERADKAEALHGVPPPMLLNDPFFQGRPQDILRQIGSLREAGVGVIDLNISKAAFSVDYDEQAANLNVFAREVLPEIRSW